MNGSRSIPPRTVDRSSLDALSRTIEGLEARIEGLMAAGARDSRPRLPLQGETRTDPLSEIRQRQRELEANRERLHPRQERHVQQESRDRAAPEPHSETGHPASAAFAQPMPATDPVVHDIARSLVGLRQELKQDITEGISREIGALRAEIRAIRDSAPDLQFSGGIHDDLARLADGIDRIGEHGAPSEAKGLRSEFEELRSLMDGLAREETVRRMESRWTGVEDKLLAFNPADIQEDLLGLAYRLDDLKAQLGELATSPANHSLDNKLLSIAGALEQIGDRLQPDDQAMAEQFAGLDIRLDEISRAIAAGSRSGQDQALLQRLESRIANLAEQLDAISQEASTQRDPSLELTKRIEALTQHVADIGKQQAARGLDERLEQLSMLMERSQQPTPSPELTGYLADISRKIDALDQGSLNDHLAERLDALSRRIEEMELRAPVSSIEDTAFLRLEERLCDIAARLDETASAPQDDQRALKGLEEQIAHLSALLSEPRAESAGPSSEFVDRIAALEEYIATNDDYIIEAARQAAEAVVEAYSRHGMPAGQAGSADMSALAALAEDLRHLEDLGRSSEERTHRTFEALHETLVQIAERLDQIDARGRTSDEEADGSRTELAAPERPAPVSQQPALADTVDTFAFKSTEMAAYPPRDDVAHAHAVAAPIIRNLPSEREDAAAKLAHAVADDVKSKLNDQKAMATGGLFSGMRRKLLGAGKATAVAVPDRAVVDPAPSIDPVEMLPIEEDNQLLEPGSGAPDIKKILERVRASQTNQNGEKADYIAAARRAAQAAAQEVDQIQRLSPGGEQSGKGTASAFSRHRRPILMAIGAVLLAMMTLPLVNTLTRGEKAPVATNVTAGRALPQQEAPEAAPVVSAETVAKAEATMATAPASSDRRPPALDSDPEGEVGTSDSIETSRAATSPASSAGATVSSGADQVTDATDSPAEAAAPVAEIEVPAGIEPQSLADAARNGDALALFEIAARYTEGRGVETDLSEAAAWYKRAADRGFAPAQYRLANLYEKGTGVSRDFAKAREYYTMAAEQGNSSAMHNLAVLFASGNAGEPDFAAAAHWFTEAAEHGVLDSQFNLAILYARGNGVTVDLEESYKWFAIAADGGDKDAAAKRDEVAKAMHPDQIEKARAKAASWQPKPVDGDANAAIIPDEWAGKGTKTASIDMKKAIRNIQAILNNNGFDAGKPDGEMGVKTVAAIKAFQSSVGQQPTGKVNDQLVRELLAHNR